MLVLNTNEQWNSWFVVSNTMIRTYPDFKNLLLYLVFPNNTIVSDETSSFNSNVPYTWQTAFSVNWTNVNFANQILDEEKMYAWNYNWWDIWTNSRFIQHTRTNWSSWNWWTKSYIYRFWFPETLEWWLVIWKKVVASFWLCSFINYSAYSALSKTITCYQELVLRIWLLHSDWTISYWNWHTINKSDTYTESTISASETKRYYKDLSKITEYEDDWLTTVDWDRIIAELNVINSQTITNPWTTVFVYTDTYVVSWFMWTVWNDREYSPRSATSFNSSAITSKKIRARPIQISIE